MAKSSALVTLERCRIVGNESYSRSPGLAFEGVAGAVLTNCCIAANSSSTFDAAGVYCYGGQDIRLVNCTIAENNCYGLTCRGLALVDLLNCIVWNNLDGSASLEGGTALVASYSCIRGEPVWAGEGNINRDPLFVWCGTYDFLRRYDFGIDGVQYHAPNMIVHAANLEPRPGSPAIDAGRAAGAPASDAGISCSPNAAPSLDGCAIIDNGTVGVRADKARLTLDACEVRGNRSDGLKLTTTDAVVRRCVLAKNGGIGIFAHGTSQVEECTVEENAGAGVQLRGAGARVADCRVAMNRNGGIACESTGAAVISGCAVLRNSSRGDGGGQAVYRSRDSCRQ